MSPEVIDTKRRALYRNEVEANGQMCLVSAFCAGILSIALILYIAQVFPLRNYNLVYIFLPIQVVLLSLPLIYRKTSLVTKPGFKYFISLQLLFVVGLLNVIVPKHAIMAYGLIIILASHYYNPRLSRIMFFATLGVMLVAIYLGMWLGEYDPNLLTSGRIRYDETGEPYLYQPETFLERWEFLRDLIVNENGNNRYLLVFAYYYLSRSAILTLIFLASYRLSQRTARMVDTQALTYAEKSRIDTELQVAQDVQRQVLPAPVLLSKELEILAQLRPAREVGGDLYDYARLDEDHYAILIGDVSGKGVPAAMFMMKTVTSFRASSSKSPSEIMRRVNALLYQGNEEAGMFVTCFLGILNIKTGVMVFANAGHNPPLLRRHGKYVPLPCAHGFLLGAMEQSVTKDEVIQLRPGDGLVLYTDGITEAKNADGDFYGEARFLSFLNGTKCSSTIELTHELEDNIMEFVGEADQSDDITFMFINFQGERTEFSEKFFPASLDAFPEVEKWIRETGAQFEVPERTVSNYLICMDEIFSNIVKYGDVPAGSDIYMRFVRLIDRNSVMLTIVDRGIPFDPREVKAKRVDERDDDEPVGGLGWLMVRELMDELAYHHVNGKNVVSISASLDKK